MEDRLKKKKNSHSSSFYVSLFLIFAENGIMHVLEIFSYSHALAAALLKNKSAEIASEQKNWERKWDFNSIKASYTQTNSSIRTKNEYTVSTFKNDI